MEKVRIYFAGKIGPDDWRTKLFGARAGGISSGDLDDQPCAQDERPLFNANYVVDMGGGVVYGGPFFISCDHSCAHGPSSHGVGAGNGPDLGNGCLSEVNGPDLKHSIPATRKDIFFVNNSRILSADWIFAYIDSFDAFGTFFEIGFSQVSYWEFARKPRLAIALSDDLKSKGNPDDLWYLWQGAEIILGGEPVTAFETFCRKVGLPWRAKPINVDRARVTTDDLFGSVENVLPIPSGALSRKRPL